MWRLGVGSGKAGGGGGWDGCAEGMGFRRPLYIIYWYAMVIGVQLGNLLGWVKSSAAVQPWHSGLYTALTVVSCILFSTVVGPLAYKAQFYAPSPEASVATSLKGLALMWLLSDTPALLLEMALAREVGFHAVIQGVSVSVRAMSWVATAFVLYLLVLRVSARWLHARTSCDTDLLSAVERMKRE